jgi:hypothetical protein
MAVVQACNSAGIAIKNTGSRCAAMLGQIVMVLFGSTTLKIPAAVIEEDTGNDFTDWLKQHVNGVGGQKIFPFGGNNQPFNDVTSNDEAPTVYTSPITKAKKQMLAGAVNLTLNTLDGGLCLAKALYTLGKSNLGIILVDKEGGFMLKKNSDGTYGFFNSQNSQGALILQNKETPYQNSINISVNPETMVQIGEYYIDNSGAILELFGLTDVEMESRAQATVTTVHAGGTFECGGGDIFDEYGSALNKAAAWKITKADGSNVTITAVSMDNVTKSYILTFATQTTGTVLTVDLATSDVLHTNNVSGIESIKPVVIAVP